MTKDAYHLLDTNILRSISLWYPTTSRNSPGYHGLRSAIGSPHEVVPGSQRSPIVIFVPPRPVAVNP